MTLPKPPKPYWKLTDEELVELARRRVRWAKRLRMPLYFVWLLIAALLVVAALTILANLAGFQPESKSHWEIYSGAVSGLMTGLFLGVQLALGITFVYGALAEGRRDELLARTWDHLKKLEITTATGEGPRPISPVSTNGSATGEHLPEAT